MEDRNKLLAIILSISIAILAYLSYRVLRPYLAPGADCRGHFGDIISLFTDLFCVAFEEEGWLHLFLGRVSELSSLA
jgi:hypothetical protein